MIMRSRQKWPINRLDFVFTREHISWTRQRNDVYELLNRLGPCRIVDLVPILEGRVTERTVYRTIKLFLEIGVTQRVNHDLIDLAPPHRQHRHFLACTNCGRRIGFYDETIEKALNRVAAKRFFESSGHQVEIRGRCTVCLAT